MFFSSSKLYATSRSYLGLYPNNKFKVLSIALGQRKAIL